jgi:hypothetical protein
MEREKGRGIMAEGPLGAGSLSPLLCAFVAIILLNGSLACADRWKEGRA